MQVLQNIIQVLVKIIMWIVLHPVLQEIKGTGTPYTYFLAFNAQCHNLREIYFLRSGFPMTDNNTLLAASPAALIT